MIDVGTFLIQMAIMSHNDCQEVNGDDDHENVFALSTKKRVSDKHPMKAPFVVHFSVGEGEQGKEVAEEADSEDNGQVEGEEGGTFCSGVLGI